MFITMEAVKIEVNMLIKNGLMANFCENIILFFVYVLVWKKLL